MMPSRREALAALAVAGALFGAQSGSARIQLLPCGDDGGVADRRLTTERCSPLALTSEWPNLKYRPLTSAPDLVDSMGYLPSDTRELPPRRTTTNDKRFLAHHPLAMAAYGQPLSQLRRFVASLRSWLPNTGCLCSVRTRDPARSRIAALVSTLEALEPGAWFFITHPSVDTPEKRRIHLMSAADVRAALKAA